MGIEDGNLNPLLRQQFNREDHGRILLKQEFLAPFVESEVIQGFNQPLSVSEKKSYFVEGKQPMFEVYRKVYGEYLYRIFKTPGKETHNNDFLFTLSKDEQAPPVNELGFHYMSSPKGSGYDIGHRIVRSQKEGISGSDYLRKAEEYLSILRKNNHISYNVLGAHSPQIGVTEFFLKNGYDFFSPEHKELFQDLKAHPEKYQMVEWDFQDDLNDREQFPVRGEAFSDQEFLQYVSEQNGKKKVTSDFETLHKFRKYLPLVTLIKRFE
jgi:hypothetical protein